VQTSAPAETLSGNIDIVLTGEATDSDDVIGYMLVEVHPIA
jgi:hypothetical protein